MTVPRHPLYPMIKFLGYDDVPGKGRITTISCEFIDLYETAINAGPVEKYESEEKALMGHKRHVTRLRLIKAP